MSEELEYADRLINKLEDKIAAAQKELESTKNHLAEAKIKAEEWRMAAEAKDLRLDRLEQIEVLYRQECLDHEDLKKHCDEQDKELADYKNIGKSIIAGADERIEKDKEIERLKGLFKYALDKAEKHMDEDIVVIAEQALKENP